jgi:cell division protein FtsQ
MKKKLSKKPAYRPTPRKKTNRRRGNLAAQVLPFALILLLAEFGAAALLSPRLQVHNVVFSGNESATREVLLKRLAIAPGTPLVKCLPGALEKRLIAEPLLSSARVGWRWPDTLTVDVTERKPAYMAKVSGAWWEIDRGGTLFRPVPNPTPGLPQILDRRERAAPKAGDVLPAETLQSLKDCLAWSEAHREFRLASVSLEKGEKLCLNSDGGMPVQLGTPVDLPRKLETLARLVSDFPEIRAGYDIAYVKLYAWDAPAVRPKKELPPPKEPLL